jgi:hypothetical protein
VGELGRGDGLGPEAGDEGLITREVLVQKLHRDLAGEHLVAGFPHLGHAAGGDDPLESIATSEEAIGARGVLGVDGHGGSHGTRRVAPVRPRPPGV